MASLWAKTLNSDDSLRERLLEKSSVLPYRINNPLYNRFHNWWSRTPEKTQVSRAPLGFRRWGGPAHRGPGSHSERLRGRLGRGIKTNSDSRCSRKQISTYRCTDGGETEESNPKQIRTGQLLSRWHYDDHIAPQTEYFRGDECPMPAFQLRVTFRGANTCLVSGQWV